ncbi:unnamed protein product [Coregonus sp. 'balchen']|nr:unnamed protein product [Coregonus sp. 'balchen']
MARYLAQIIVMGTQVVGRAFARALRQEYAASQAAAEARGRAGQQSAAASSITGMTLQEAQQILNISTLTPEELHKVFTHTHTHTHTLKSTLKTTPREHSPCPSPFP